MHHAVEYEMKTAAAPEKAIAKSRVPRLSAGLRVVRTTNGSASRTHSRKDRSACWTDKFRASDSDPQSSKMMDATTRMGMESRLL